MFWSMLAACTSEPEREAPRALPSWTVAVFMNGDNDIEPMVPKDLDELERAVTDDVHVVVQADRIPGYTDGDGDWTGTRRYALTADAAPGVASAPVAELGEVDMGSPEALADFLAWVVAEHPSDHLALVMWNHGGGYWISSDDTSGSRIDLTRGELDEALADTVAARGKLDVLAFDACNMGQWETAYSVADEAQVLVASQAWVNFPGYAYDVAFPSLPADPTAAELGDALARSAIDPNGGHTHAALDLEGLGPLSQAVDDLGGAWLAMPDGLGAFGDVREAARGLDRQWDEYWLDLGDLADGGALVGDPAVASASAAVRDHLDEIVIGRYGDERHAWASGLTIFTDTSRERWIDQYERGPWAETRWDELLVTARDAGL